MPKWLKGVWNTYSLEIGSRTLHADVFYDQEHPNRYKGHIHSADGPRAWFTKKYTTRARAKRDTIKLLVRLIREEPGLG